MMESHRGMHGIAFVLAMIGAVNWGLVGAFDWNLVKVIFGMSTVATIIYILIGLSGLYLIFTHSSSCRHCGKDMTDQTPPVTPMN